MTLALQAQIEAEVALLADAIDASVDLDKITKLTHRIMTLIWNCPRSVALPSLAAGLAMYADAIADEVISREMVLLLFIELLNRFVAVERDQELLK